jgi:hypothetical protein
MEKIDYFRKAPEQARMEGTREAILDGVVRYEARADGQTVTLNWDMFQEKEGW